MRAEAGDYVVTEGDGRWSVQADIFESTYRLRPDGLFEKTATIRAREVEATLKIATLEGLVHARKGDFLALGPAGDVWPIPPERFLSRYVAIRREPPTA